MKELIDEFIHEDPNRGKLFLLMIFSNSSTESKILPPLNHFEFTEANESNYDGEMQGGKRHGRGKMTFKTGEYYEGEWRDNLMDGYGVLYDGHKNKIYEGHYSKGKMEGSGILYNTKRSPSFVSTDHLQISKIFDFNSENWIKFEGVFKENKWEGIGKLYFANGDMYYGEVREGMLHGNGCLYTEGGQVISQVWENNRLIVSDVLATEGADFE